MNGIKIIKKNRFEQPNFNSKTDIEVISKRKNRNKSKGSADVVGFRLLTNTTLAVLSSLPNDIADRCQFTSNGIFTKDKTVAMYLIQDYSAVLIT
jgi:hypothetical protein